MAIIWFDLTSGNDSNNGSTKALAKASLSSAWSAASNNDEIVLVDGVHTLTANVFQGLSGAKTGITIRSEGNSYATCVINGANSYYYGHNIPTNGTADITFQDITITGMTGRFIEIYAGVNNNSFTFQRIKFINGPSILGPTIPMIANGGNDSITNVRNCIFEGQQGFMDATDAILGSRIAAVTGSTFNFDNNTVYFDDVVNSIVFANAAAGGNSTVNVRNNIFYNDTTNDFYLISSVAAGTFTANCQNNCIFDNSTGVTTKANATYITLTSDTGNIAIDPQFNDQPNGDYRPATGTALENGGTIIA